MVIKSFQVKKEVTFIYILYCIAEIKKLITLQE